MSRWPSLVRNFEESHGFPQNGLRDLVQKQLARYAFPLHIVHAEDEVDEFPNEEKDVLVHEAVKSLFRNQIISFDEEVNGNDIGGYCSAVDDRGGARTCLGDDLFFVGETHLYRHSHPRKTSEWLFRLQQFSSGQGSDEYSSWLPQSIVPRILRQSQQFIIYQSLGADTGGTIALQILHKQLVQLGYRAILCDEKNMEDKHCLFPSNSDIVITGEWCRGVLVEHGDGPANFAGRGIQYHLGFHHYSDLCPGHVTTTDSHQINALLSSRIFSGYFLGCPMVDSIRDLFTKLLFLKVDECSKLWEEQPDVQEEIKYLMTLKKENLIVLDMDILHDYPPRYQDVMFAIPDGYQLLRLHEIPRHRMGSILLRAKIVLDLAMPGPERLAGEGILAGAIPIVSKLWNGASALDFPSIRKVDSLNNTEISIALQEVADNYQQELESTKNSYFQGYILSLWQRLHNTVDIYMGSSSLQFVLVAQSFKEEVLVCFQVIGILYNFPLASIDVYVRDDMWFTRHHYLLLSLLKESGYIRHDRYDPSTKNDNSSQSFLRVKTLKELHSIKKSISSDNDLGEMLLGNSPLFPRLNKKLVVFLPLKIVPTTSESLYQTVSERIELNDDDTFVRSSYYDIYFDIISCGIDNFAQSNVARWSGAVFSPTVPLQLFFEKYEASNAPQELSFEKTPAATKWREISDLLSGDHVTEYFVDSVVSTVTWQRFLKMINDTTVLSNIIETEHDDFIQEDRRRGNSMDCCS